MTAHDNNEQSASRIHFGEREGVRGARHSAPLLNDAKSVKFQQEKGEWDKAEAFLKA